MKTKRVLAVMISFLFLLYGCSNTDDNVEESEFASKRQESKNSVINQTYPQAQAEVLETFGAIAASIINGAGYGKNGPYMDQLISFHAYGDKFVEFNGGESFTSEQNEANERTLFGDLLEKWDYDVNRFAAVPGTLKVAVYYGNVANLTFTSDFILTFKGNTEVTPVNNLITLLFVKTKGKWKMVHEHHSLANMDNGGSGEESGTAGKTSGSKGSSVTNQTYTQAQSEVIETFMAIATSITKGAGNGKNGPYMDQLISFHAYGDKFVEFNNGESFDSEGNERNERQLFGEDLEEWDYNVNQFAPIDGTVKVAVYNGNVANLTFISDFKLTHKTHGLITVNNLITLLFVKTQGEWKMVHEHHSPAKLPI